MFPRRIPDRLGRRPHLILAGGLTPSNVGEAIRLARPDAVDVCSGVERCPGRKDPEKVGAFLRAVEEADAVLAA
jgi:phosphoribosylanthranilate isomerase